MLSIKYVWNVYYEAVKTCVLSAYETEGVQLQGSMPV